jgi:DNA-binding protein Fis
LIKTKGIFKKFNIFRDKVKDNDIKSILSPISAVDKGKFNSMFKSHNKQSPLKSRSSTKNKIASNTIVNNIDMSINTLSNKITSSITKVPGRRNSKTLNSVSKYIVSKGSSKNTTDYKVADQTTNNNDTTKVSNFNTQDALNIRPSTSKIKNTLKNSLNQLNSLTNTILYPNVKTNTSVNLTTRLISELRDSQKNIFSKEFACCSISNVDNSEIKAILGKFCNEAKFLMKEVNLI